MSTTTPKSPTQLVRRLARLLPYFGKPYAAWLLVLGATLVLSLTEPMIPYLLKPLLEAHLQATGSAKAAEILADWDGCRGSFKLLVPPSEKATVGLVERQAVAA